jgi:hypothetical protein
MYGLLSSVTAVLQCERVKVLFVNAMKSHRGSRGLASLSTSALNEGRGQSHVPAALPLWKDIPVPMG